MPLVKVFARSNLSKKVPLKSLQAKLCDIWGTKPETTKLMLFRCEDWTDESFQEDCFLDIRAYGRLLVVCCEVSLFVAVFSNSWLDSTRLEHTLICYHRRCKGKAERTREFVLEGLQSVQEAFKNHDLVVNIRLETYEGERYFHMPPTKSP